MSRLQELTDVILPRIAASGRLGDKVQFVKCSFDESVSGEAQFASSVCFVVAVFQNDNGTHEQPMVVKYNMGDEAVRQWLKLDYQFRNEVVVYEKVLPFLGRGGKISDIFPKYFYGSACEQEDPNKYVIVLEDLRASGYKLSPELLNLDHAHCALAFKKLGEFHALSFASKQLNPESFYRVANELIEARLFNDNKEDSNDLYGLSFERASGPLLKNGEYVSKIQSFKTKLNNSQEYLEKVVTVQEPMGVICHGDFCRNNVLFKYENESPVDVKFFDLATARYSSPMIDFTFFFFLNCSEDSRKLYREEYLRTYYEALVSSVPPEVKIPSLEAFREEFRRKAVYGFLISSFFKPAMMDPRPFNPEVEVRWSREKRAEKLIQNGGEKGTEVIVNMLRELFDLECIFLPDNIKKKTRTKELKKTLTTWLQGRPYYTEKEFMLNQF